MLTRSIRYGFRASPPALPALPALAALMASILAAAADPAPVDEYPIHADGGIVYDPLAREARKTGGLERHLGAPCTERELRLSGSTLRAKVPMRALAYDTVPIPYELTWDDRTGAAGAVGAAASPATAASPASPAAAAPSFPIAVEATAFEDESRRRGRDLYDLALPGRIDLDVELLGSITAHLRPGGRHDLSADLSDEPGRYPPFDRRPFVRSGVIEAGDLVWLQVRFTNTGDTILDAEGFGGCLIYPRLLERKGDGRYEAIGTPYNLYYRDLEYLYPGESRDLWLHLTSNLPGYAEGRGSSGTPQGFGIAPGEYRLEFRLFCRCYRTPDVFLNIWEGPLAFACEIPFTVEARPREAPILPGRKTLSDGPAGAAPDRITRFIHTFEEFLTAFDCHQAPPADGSSTAGGAPTADGSSTPEGSSTAGGASRIAGTLHLQVAPWTRHVVLKLIGSGPVSVDSVSVASVSIASAAVPIEVESSSLDLVFDPDPPACRIRDGLREPIIASQTMADMRTNVQLGPFPERHIRERLREMMDCGVNVVATTAMPWLYDDRRRPASNYQGDALKYVLDVARLEGMAVEGWGAYPFDRGANRSIAEWITGRPSGITEYASGEHMISHADPMLPAANAAVWLYQFRRWGDLYLQLEGGKVPIGVEDTRGWMRQDVNVRHPMGAATVRAFREWARERYGRIEDANAAWGSAYRSFDEVEPEEGQVANPFGHIWEYTREDHPFRDWSRAVADLDEFRTEQRVANYRDTLELVRKEIPGAVISLRTEGGNVLVGGLDPQDPNPHLRHIYYSQRRCAAIAEIIQSSGLVKVHCDYTTVPYTPSELRRLVRAAVAQGIVPMYFAQFDNMRDIAINGLHGSDYQVHFNLPEPRKGYMMHVLTALYPWFKAVYEEGGIPGILWEDIQCDGFATETQKREMRLFRERLAACISTSEAREARAKGVKPPCEEWRKGSRALWSYRFEEAPGAGP